MTWLFFLALSAIAAVLFNPVGNLIAKAEAKVAAGSTGANTFFGTYAGKTAVTTAVFFVVLLTAATVMTFIGGKKSAEIPGVL